MVPRREEKWLQDVKRNGYKKRMKRDKTTKEKWLKDVKKNG